MSVSGWEFEVSLEYLQSFFLNYSDCILYSTTQGNSQKQLGALLEEILNISINLSNELVICLFLIHMQWKWQQLGIVLNVKLLKFCIKLIIHVLMLRRHSTCVEGLFSQYTWVTRHLQFRFYDVNHHANLYNTKPNLHFVNIFITFLDNRKHKSFYEETLSKSVMKTSHKLCFNDHFYLRIRFKNWALFLQYWFFFR